MKLECRLHLQIILIVCNNKQRWDNDKYRYECKELIEKGICDNGFVWNPNKCKCEFDKSCDVRDYLDYERCKCRKRLVDKLIEECSEDIDENKLIYNRTLNDYGNVCNSCTIYIVLLAILLIINIGISCAFIYFLWYLKEDNTSITNINADTETVIC